MDDTRQKTQHLPSVDTVLRTGTGVSISSEFGHKASVDAIRAAISSERSAGHFSAMPEEIAQAAHVLLTAQNTPRLRPVLNLTGTVLHTNLGRAVLPQAAIDAAAIAMSNPVALEFDMGEGARGQRDDVVRDLLCALTGAEDATIVNNNAAAVLLALNTFAAGREAIVSRGELIEIGGAFRMPDIMVSAGAELREVGTTNRTHFHDYETAMNPNTGLILKVHTSNYRVEGFTKSVPASELACLAHKQGISLVDDLGSGSLVDLSPYGLPREPTVSEAIAAGADLITFSGDKLLGGPQAGFIVGRRDLIAQINKNPMKRAFRLDKIRLAATEAVLRLYRDPDRLAERLPTHRALARSVDDILAQATELAPKVAATLGEKGVSVEVKECASQVGSGALPLNTLPSYALALTPSGDSGRAVEALSAGLRALPLAIVGRIHDGAVWLDLRCLEDSSRLLAALEGRT